MTMYASLLANLKRFPTKFIEMCQSSVANNEELEVDFRLLVESLASAEGASNPEVGNGLFKALVSKLANTRIIEFMNAKVERDVTSERMAKLWTQTKCCNQNSNHTHYVPNASKLL